MPQLFCWVVFSTLDIRFWASPLMGFCMYALVEALSMYQSFLVHDNVYGGPMNEAEGV